MSRASCLLTLMEDYASPERIELDPIDLRVAKRWAAGLLSKFWKRWGIEPKRVKIVKVTKSLSFSGGKKFIFPHREGKFPVLVQVGYDISDDPSNPPDRKLLNVYVEKSEEPTFRPGEQYLLELLLGDYVFLVKDLPITALWVIDGKVEGAWVVGGHEKYLKSQHKDLYYRQDGLQYGTDYWWRANPNLVAIDGSRGTYTIEGRTLAEVKRAVRAAKGHLEKDGFDPDDLFRVTLHLPRKTLKTTLAALLT